MSFIEVFMAAVIVSILSFPIALFGFQTHLNNLRITEITNAVYAAQKEDENLQSITYSEGEKEINGFKVNSTRENEKYYITVESKNAGTKLEMIGFVKSNDYAK
ncbi:MAG: hypothetical protein ACM3KR_01200 [Deltaproteobacteria bacterium]